MAEYLSCTFEGCNRRRRKNRLCMGHNRQVDRGETLTPLIEYHSDICSFSGCDNPRWARGFCGTHYQQWRSGGELYPINEKQRPKGLPAKDLERWFWSQFEENDDGCLVWTRYLNPRGYGQVSWSGRAVLTHRIAWELKNGVIPDGMQLDHACWNHACGNVDHLRVVTNKENNENRSPKIRNRTGFRGITFHVNEGKWSARVTHNYITHYVGFFDGLEDAVVAVMDKRAKLFTHCQEAPEALELYRRKTGRDHP